MRIAFSVAPVACVLVLAACGDPPASAQNDLSAVADLHMHALEDLSTPDDEGDPGDLTPVPGPSRLSESGLYADIAQKTLAPDVIRYRPRYELWSDGAEKDRFLRLPPNAQIDTSQMDDWVFPVGTAVWKEFRIGGKRIETRLLQKVYPNPGGWYEIAFLWDEAEAEATAVPKGQKAARGTTHDVPDVEACGKCHGNVADVLLGVSAIQLSTANGKGLLSELAAMGKLTNPPAGEFQPPGAGPVQDALGYLHGNCGSCHNRVSIFATAVELKLRLSVSDMRPEDTDTYRTSIKIPLKHIFPPDVRIAVVPGDPTHSQLYRRMGVRDDWAMPNTCTKVVDAAGMALVGAWINGLPR